MGYFNSKNGTPNSRGGFFSGGGGHGETRRQKHPCTTLQEGTESSKWGKCMKL